MIWRLTAGGQGAAACRILRTLVRSKSCHGASRMRTKFAGTMCEVETRSVSIKVKQDSAVNRSMMTTVLPSPRCICAYEPGAVWYAGPHNRWTSDGVNPQNAANAFGG